MDELRGPIDGDAVVLAGGQSLRMGRDKAQVVLDGKTLVERLVEALRGVFRRVHVSIDPARPLQGCSVAEIRDSRPGLGPLEGVRASLEALGAPALFVAVDMPLFWPPLARGLWEEAAAAGSGCRGAVPRWSGGVEPAFAVYTPALVADIERLMAAERRALHQLAALPGVEVLDLDRAEVRSRLLGPGAPAVEAIFRNLNTPEDVAAFCRLHGGNQPKGRRHRHRRSGK